MPKSLGKLSKLKVLDLSNNELISLPEEICTLVSLEVFNVNKNLLATMPSVSGLVKLHKLNISHNKLKNLPDGICDPKLAHLSHILASNNHIEQMPAELSNLPHLNVLDISENQMVDIPPELCQCARLKELNLKGNNIQNKKLGKILEQSSKKSIFDFLSNLLEKQQKSEGSSRGNRSGKNKKKSRLGKNEADELGEDLVKCKINVSYFRGENRMSIIVTPAVLNIRPYIVCCLVKNLNFNKNNAFKKFIALQTKFHDTICDKRQAATIATHDMNLVKSPLTYDAKVPSHIKITPLFAKEELTAQSLVSNLRKEADEIRKEKKRNKLSGIHKYLDLLHEKPEYPCLVDKEGCVISFPPITNSDKTKISKDTTSLLIEVTSSRSLHICKEVMDTLLQEMLNMGIGERLSGKKAETPGSETEESNTNDKYKITVQQVNVINQDNSLRVVYPSRTDLNSDLIQVTYDCDE